MSFTEKERVESAAPAELAQLGLGTGVAAERRPGLSLAEAYSLPAMPAELCAADIRRLRLEGRRAAFEGRSMARCPYGLADQARRKAWLSGFGGER